jgi:TonB family protein
MSANSRNFWILLTTFALTFSAAQWLGRSRTHHVKKNYRTVEVDYKCNKKKKKKRKCGTSEVRVYKNCNLNRYHSRLRTPSIHDNVFADKEPRVINMDVVRKHIGYPSLAQDAGIQGKVIVRVLVDEFGNYRDHKVVLRSHPILSKQVEKHIHELSFMPATRNGQAIQYWINLPFNFRLPK